MNSASKLLLGTLLVALFAPHGALAQTAAAVTDPVPPPSPRPLAESDDMSDFVGEGAETTSPLSDASELLRMLQTGNSGKPLTISQLAEINDAIKRMDYVNQLEKKIQEAGGGGLSGGISPAVTSSPSPAMNLGSPAEVAVVGQQSADAYSVLQIFGSAGRYQAVVYDGKKQIRVRSGDLLPSGQVSSITMGGVILSTNKGNTLLPFMAPGVVAGVQVSSP